MSNNLMRLFGFTFGPNTSITKEIPREERSPVTPSNEDGAVTIQSTPYYGTYVDLEGAVRNEVELITRYREMSLQTELERAIDEIINEAIQKDEEGDTVELDLDDLKVSDQTKDKIVDEFDSVLKLLNWHSIADDIFRRWYIDGRIYYHIIVNEKDAPAGVKELRYVDPRRIRKVREIQKKKDPITGADVIDKINEYYLYSEKITLSTTVSTNLGIKIAPDAIINVNSGKMDAKGLMVLSYLHKAIKPLNNLRMVEDAMVIYRLSRAPERRIFYIDVGNMERKKAEQYLYDIMMKYRNKLVYDSTTGEIKDDRKHLSMMEDFWIPRRGEGKSTEITTLQSGQNLSKIEDAEYFKKKLYESLSIPVSRLNLDGNGPSLVGIGRSAEVTRDEQAFAKFIDRLRNKFSNLFLDALGIQLRLKNICNEEEWNILKQDIKFNWLKSNNIDELIQAELLRERIATLSVVDPYIGRFYSAEWVWKNVLKMNEEEIEEMKMQIEKERSEGNAALTGSAGEVMAQQADIANQQAELGLDAQQVGIDYMKKMPAADKDTAAMIMAPVLTGQPLTAPQQQQPVGAGGPGGGAPGAVAGQPLGGKQGAAMGLKVPSVPSPLGQQSTAQPEQGQNPQPEQGKGPQGSPSRMPGSGFGTGKNKRLSKKLGKRRR